MNLKQSMIKFAQEQKNKRRVIAWKLKIDCLKRNHCHVVPSLFTAENSHISGAKLLPSDTAAPVSIGGAL